MEDRDERLGEQEEVGDRREARRIGGGGRQMRGEENRGGCEKILHCTACTHTYVRGRRETEEVED